MSEKLNALFLLIVSLLWTSCGSIHDDLSRCRVYLQFTYDYNMEYTCSFVRQVPCIDVYVFDENGMYLFRRQEKTSNLIDGNKMLLTGLTPGVYQVFAVGGLTDNFHVEESGQEFRVGRTSLEQVRTTLVRSSNEVDYRFASLWVGAPVRVLFGDGLSVWEVGMMKYTDDFNIVLSSLDTSDERSVRNYGSRYTFEIVAPEGASYSNAHEPLLSETLTYKPWHLQAGSGTGEISHAKINTCRLFDGETMPHKLVVREADTKELRWEADLVDLLKYSKPSVRPDGTSLSVQEYLDRESAWNLIVLYREDSGAAGNGFLAAGIEINGWIVWFSDIEM